MVPNLKMSSENVQQKDKMANGSRFPPPPPPQKEATFIIIEGRVGHFKDKKSRKQTPTEKKIFFREGTNPTLELKNRKNTMLR